MRRSILALGAGLIFLIGCGSEPRLDASSDAALGASAKAMGDRLSEQKKAELTRSMTALSLPVLMKGAFNKDAPKPTAMDLFKPCHGMTADEIIEKAKSIPLMQPKSKSS